MGDHGVGRFVPVDDGVRVAGGDEYEDAVAASNGGTCMVMKYWPVGMRSEAPPKPCHQIWANTGWVGLFDSQRTPKLSPETSAVQGSPPQKHESDCRYPFGVRATPPDAERRPTRTPPRVERRPARVRGESDPRCREPGRLVRPRSGCRGSGGDRRGASVLLRIRGADGGRSRRWLLGCHFVRLDHCLRGRPLPGVTRRIGSAPEQADRRHGQHTHGCGLLAGRLRRGDLQLR